MIVSSRAEVGRTIVPPSLLDQVNQATSASERTTVYANAGVWQEAVSTLATQRCLTPTDTALSTSWQNLLKSVRLDNYADEPIVCPR